MYCYISPDLPAEHEAMVPHEEHGVERQHADQRVFNPRSRLAPKRKEPREREKPHMKTHTRILTGRWTCEEASRLGTGTRTPRDNNNAANETQRGAPRTRTEGGFRVFDRSIIAPWW